MPSDSHPGAPAAAQTTRGSPAPSTTYKVLSRRSALTFDDAQQSRSLADRINHLFTFSLRARWRRLDWLLRGPVTSWSLTPGPGRNPWAFFGRISAVPEFDMIRAVLLVVLAVLDPSPALAETFNGGRAVIIDGDTFALGSERVRILNIDAPETRGSRCERELVLGGGPRPRR